MAHEPQPLRHRSTAGSTSLITGGFSDPGTSSDQQQMQHGFESTYSLFNSHHGRVPLRDPSGVATAGWKAFFDSRPSGDLRCSSSSTSPKHPMASDATAEFYQPGGAFSEMAEGQGELLTVAPDPAAWQAGRLVLDDSSLRCLLPGAGVGQPRQGLSLSLCNSRTSEVSLPQQQQSFNLMEGMRHQSLSNLRSGLVTKATTDAHVQAQNQQQQQHSLLQVGQFFPQLVMGSPSSPGFCSQPPLHLTSSKYLVPIQELLNEFCSLGAGSNGEGPKKKSHSQWEEGASSSSTQWNQSLLSLDILELKKRMAKLVSMLEEVDSRYRRYCEKMRAVVSSFEAVAGEGAAAMYSAMASKAMSRHFRCLRDGIVRQIRVTMKALGEKDPVAPGTTRGETPRLRLLDHYIRQQKAFQQASMMETHPWRPQRGLPERSVSVLRAWLFEHFLHPYPSDVDKHILARQAGLSRSQVCNWFINARVRLWKPMVEEMYLEETRELENQSAQGNTGQEEGRQPGHGKNPIPSETPHLLLPDDQKPRPPGQLGGGSDADDSLSSVVNGSHNSERLGDAAGGKDPRYAPLRPYHHQLQQLARADNNNFGVVDMDFPSYNECGGGGHQSFGSGAVSLTLGLQQHNGEGMSLSFSPGSQSTLLFPKEPMDSYQPVQFSILEGDAQNPPYRNHLMGSQQLLHDL